MKTITPSQFDLEQIADSGQCFRWNRISDYKYRIIAFGKILNIEQDLETGSVTMDCSDSDFDNIWKDYFDLGTDYGKIIERIPEDDEYLKRAASICDGIRIIKQDPWETLITFIISQRKNIPAIKASVEKICKAAGNVIGEADGEKLYAFPTPKQLSSLSMDDLNACSLGYLFLTTAETEAVSELLILISGRALAMKSFLTNCAHCTESARRLQIAPCSLASTDLTHSRSMYG